MDTVESFVEKMYAMNTSSASRVVENGVEPPSSCPKLTTIISQLQREYKEYRFTVYRTAMKFITLQKVFFTSSIPYKLVLAVMERHGIRDGQSSLMVPPFQLTSLIQDIYYACEKFGHFSKMVHYKRDSASSLLANFFWNIYDPHRRHSISLLEIKLTFLILCKLYASDDLVAEVYNLVSHPQRKCVTKLCFENLLNIFIKIFSYIGEGSAYGTHNAQTIMNQCFTKDYDGTGLTEYQFHCLWSTKQTRFIIYANVIALIKRIEDTEKLIHNNPCSSCHIEKIVGIRFKCRNCKDISLCLKCFAKGLAPNKHEAKHRMYEVFTDDLPPKKFSNFFAKLCNLFSTHKNSEETCNFCNANETTTSCSETDLNSIPKSRTSNASTVTVGTAAAGTSVPQANEKIQNTTLNQNKEIHKLEPSLVGLITTASNASSVSERLQTIIDKLLLQNFKLEQQLKCVRSSSQDDISRFLRAHQRFLKDIISEMRNFSTSTQLLNAYPASSTPNRQVLTDNPSSLDNFNVKEANNVKEDCSRAVLKSANENSNLTHSINGADVNRTYLEANKSDYSINDLSLWFNQRRLSSMPSSLTSTQPMRALEAVAPLERDSISGVVASTCATEMANFKLLLNKVKEIVEDSYSDNTELSAATQNLENVLDTIIKGEESRRSST